MNVLPLEQWHDFYVLIGTAAGAIVGATFVVASLASNIPNRAFGIRGFITPTAVHLGSVVVASAALTVPRLDAASLAVLFSGGGVAGAVYGLIVAGRIWRADLDLTDRLFYVVLPVLAYAGLAGAAAASRFPVQPRLETIAALLVALLIIGMRNAWDMASFMIMRDPDRK